MKKIVFNFLKIFLVSAVLFLSAFFSINNSHSTYALPEDFYTNPDYAEVEDPTNNTSTDRSNSGDSTEESGDSISACQDETGALSWAICPLVNTITSAVDSLYGLIEGQLTIPPVNMSQDGPIHHVWEYMRDITNVIFIIFLIVVIYSQITGVGISNYGIKRALPRLIIAAILINLSFVFSAMLVDISNIAGSSIKAFFDSMTGTVFNGVAMSFDAISWGEITKSVMAGSGIAALGIYAAGGIGSAFWLLLLAIIGAIVSVAIGLATVALRQGVVAVLVMVAPLAIVAYMLPNTNRWFERWRQIFISMLTFYPMFAFLFGACKLIGWALILSATSVFMVIVGLAITVLPLFLAISLLKMSGTVLGGVYNGLNRLTSPLRQSASSYLGTYTNRARLNSLYRNATPGAKLRNYLAYRDGLRQKEISDTAEIISHRTTARVMNRVSSTSGRDSKGNRRINTRPNRYMTRAKMAGLESTRAQVAAANYNNTLNEFGDHFQDAHSKLLSGQHAEAFLDSMVESYREVNNAQSDQDYLLGRFLEAGTNMYKNPTEYNRLIKGASGSLGHTGESAVLGQVITKNSQIETRRRGEANIIMNKFGVDKPISRAFIYDKAAISDDGREIGIDGKEIEDEHFRLYDGAVSRQWGQFIAIHKETRREIDSTKYNLMPSEEKAQYDRIRYFDITDDNGNPVQRVYSDDAGYMKELLIRDIAIGDPINRRYVQSIGVKDTNAPVLDDQGNTTGLLRKYHGTIAGALLSTKYKEHAAEISPMITAQADHGYINTDSQFVIAGIDSVTKAAKSGALLQNDAYAIRTWTEILNLAQGKQSPVNKNLTFEDLFTDADVLNYRNVNGQRLHGMRLGVDANGNPEWQKVNRDELDASDLSDHEKAELKRNFIRHSMVPDLAERLFGLINRNPSANILDSQKPATAEALVELMNTIGDLGLANADQSLDFSQRLNPKKSILGTASPNEVRQRGKDLAAQYQRILAEQKKNTNSNTPINTTARTPMQNLNDQLRRATNRSDLDSIDALLEQINEVFQTPDLDSETLRNSIVNLASENQNLTSDNIEQLRSILDGLQPATVDPNDVIGSTINDHHTPQSQQEAIDQLLGKPNLDSEQLEQTFTEIADYLKNL